MKTSKVIAGILTMPCQDAAPGISCDPAAPGELVQLKRDGSIVAHTTRIIAALAAGTVYRFHLMKLFGSNPPAAFRPPAKEGTPS